MAVRSLRLAAACIQGLPLATPAARRPATTRAFTASGSLPPPALRPGRRPAPGVTNASPARGCSRVRYMSYVGGEASNGLWNRGEKWLQRAAVKSSKRIFLYNLRGALLRTNEALGMESMYVERVEEAFEILWERESECALSDERSQYHVQAACLALATHRVLSEQLPLNQEEVVKIIQQCMGDSDSFGERAVQLAIRAASKVFLQMSDPYSALTEVAQRMVHKDWGPSFKVDTLDSTSPPHDQTGPPQDGFARTGPPHDTPGPPQSGTARSTDPPQNGTGTARTGPPREGGETNKATRSGEARGAVTGPLQDRGARRTGASRESGEERVVVVHACPYNSLLRKYDALHLVAPIFCRADALLFEKASGTALGALKSGDGGASFSLAGTALRDLEEGAGGASFFLGETLADGAPACRFIIRRTLPSKQ